MHPPPLRPLLSRLPSNSPRTFSTTTLSLARPSRTQLEHRHRNIPTYPYGPSLLYKKSNFGLYGNVRPQFGNTVSEQNEIKTRRKWNPNIHTKRLWSAALDKHVRIKVQARVLRTIDKVGGLDEYLLGESPGRVKELGMEGWRMRWRLLQKASVKERMRMRRVALGVPSGGIERWLGDEELMAGKEDEGKEDEGKEVDVKVVDEDGNFNEDEVEDVSQEEQDKFMKEFEEQNRAKGRKTLWGET